MISLGRLISATPIPVIGKIKFHQTSVGQILDMGEATYWSLIKVWDLKRIDMIPQETPESKMLTDFQVWCALITNIPDFRKRVIASVHCFLHTKIEFLPISNTIMNTKNTRNSNSKQKTKKILAIYCNFYSPKNNKKYQ